MATPGFGQLPVTQPISVEDAKGTTVCGPSGHVLRSSLLTFSSFLAALKEILANFEDEANIQRVKEAKAAAQGVLRACRCRVLFSHT